MSDELTYKLSVTVERGAEIDDIENKLESLMKKLYDTDSVEGVTVVDKSPPIDEDMDELLSVIDDLENQDIMQAIDLVLALEKMDE